MEKQVAPPRLANLLWLSSEADTDYYCEYANESIQEDFCKHWELLEAQILSGYGIDKSKFLLHYGWYGYGGPFSGGETKMRFDPRLVNVVVPVNNTSLRIQADKRKVVLTVPALYGGEEAKYCVFCASKNAVDGIRVLPTPEAPFKNLESVFSDEGFESLPKLRDLPQYGGIIVLDGGIIVPESWDEGL